MTVQLSAAVRGAMIDALETAIGVSPVIKLLTGAAPANCAAGDTGTVIATINLPANWLADAASGVKTLLGTWSDSSADATGTPGYFRLYSSGGTCHLQGTVTATGGGGDLTLDDMTIVAGQVVTITSFTLTGSNA